MPVVEHQVGVVNVRPCRQKPTEYCQNFRSATVLGRQVILGGQLTAVHVVHLTKNSPQTAGDVGFEVCGVQYGSEQSSRNYDYFLC